MFRVISCQEETAASHIINFWQKWEKALGLTCADDPENKNIGYILPIFYCIRFPYFGNTLKPLGVCTVERVCPYALWVLF